MESKLYVPETIVLDIAVLCLSPYAWSICPLPAKRNHETDLM